MMSTVKDVSSLGLTNAGAKSKTSAEDIQDRFLTLLVTQIQNQDPLNPMDNAQVTSQLAQLNTVSGIAQLNKTMEGLAATFGAGQTLQAASMVGRNVMVAGDTADLVYNGNAGQAYFGAELTQPVDALQVSIYDQAGKLVHA